VCCFPQATLSNPAGPGTRPAPRKELLRLGRSRHPRSPRALTRRREPAIIVAATRPAMRLQEARALLLLVEVPVAEPGTRRSARGARPHGSWHRRLLLPIAASTAASRAWSPSTSSSPCALRQRGGRAGEGGDRGGSEALSTCPGARAPGRGGVAADAARASLCSPPTAAAEKQGAGLAARQQRNNFP
jgi:hypothetical protein